MGRELLTVRGNPVIVFNDSHLPSGGNDAVRPDMSKEAELKKPRSHRKGEAANRSCEVHATIYLAKGKRIAIDRELDSLLDALEGGVEYVDVMFIRFVRGA